MEKHEGLPACQGCGPSRSSYWLCGRLQGSHCLTMGWVSQHRPAGLCLFNPACRQAMASLEIRRPGRATPPGLCWLRQDASKSLGLEDQRMARRVIMGISPTSPGEGVSLVSHLPALGEVEGHGSPPYLIPSLTEQIDTCENITFSQCTNMGKMVRSTNLGCRPFYLQRQRHLPAKLSISRQYAS